VSDEFVPRLSKVGSTALERTSLALRLADSARFNEALREVELALRENPELPLAHWTKGRILFLQGSDREALPCFQTAVSLDEELYCGWASLANVYERMGSLAQGLDAIGRAIALDPDSGAAHVRRGDILVGLMRHQDAAASYRRALDLDPGIARAHYQLAVLSRNAGALETALRQALEAQAIDPLLRENTILLAELLEERGEIPRARAFYRSVSTGSPDALPIRKEGLAFEREGLPGAALASLSEALAEYPEDLPTYMELARLFVRQERIEEARLLCRAALRIEPSYSPAKRFLADLDEHTRD
jgi:tetratricopeptide (TPR) repeat protein